MLYFNEEDDLSKLPHYMKPTRQPRELQKDITFKFDRLEPKVIIGNPIV